MARGGRRRRTVDKLSLDERLRSARDRTSRLVSHVSSMFPLHEANRIIVYSGQLANQIPRSMAAQAFHQLQQSMLFSEVVRLMAIWDVYGEDRDSIPSVISLINHPEILARVIEEDRQYHLNVGYTDLTPSDDPEIEAMKAQWWEADRQSTAETETRKTRRRLSAAVGRTVKIMASEELEALKRFRDRFIAHNLIEPASDSEQAASERRARYGDERKLLEKSQMIVHWLHLALNGTSFHWDDARASARRSAGEFWGQLRFGEEDSKH